MGDVIVILIERKFGISCLRAVQTDIDSLWQEEIDQQGGYDLLVVINGCSSECLMNEKYGSTSLIINNLNYEAAAELVQEALR